MLCLATFFYAQVLRDPSAHMLSLRTLFHFRSGQSTWWQTQTLVLLIHNRQFTEQEHALNKPTSSLFTDFNSLHFFFPFLFYIFGLDMDLPFTFLGNSSSLFIHLPSPFAHYSCFLCPGCTTLLIRTPCTDFIFIFLQQTFVPVLAFVIYIVFIPCLISEGIYNISVFLTHKSSIKVWFWVDFLPNSCAACHWFMVVKFSAWKWKSFLH